MRIPTSSLPCSHSHNAGLLPRQIEGSAACNQARLAIVGALGDTRDNVGEIADATVAQAAMDGLEMAGSGIREIGAALIAGEAPPQDGRDTTEAGLAATADALAVGDA